MKQNGLTLIEILIALVVIAVAFMALASVQISNLNVTRDSQQTSQATQYANKVLEDATLKVSKYNDPDYEISKYYGCPDTTAVDCIDYPEPKDGYTATAKFTGLYQEPLAGETRTPEQFANEGLVRVDIDVTGPTSVSFSSYISCYDVLQTSQLDESSGDPCQPTYERP